MINKELTYFVKKRIQQWTSQGRANTLLDLSSKTQLGYSTVRRIAAGGEPEFQSFMQLATVLMTPEETVQAVKKFFPEARKSIERPFQYMQSQKTDPIFSKDCLLVIALCCPDDGIEEAALQSIIGTKNMSIVRGLLECEIIMRRDTRLKLSADYIFDSKPDNVLKWIGFLVELFDRERASELGHFTGIRFEGMNQKGVEKLQEVMTRAEREIDGILGDKDLRGDISVGIGLVSALMKPKE